MRISHPGPYDVDLAMRMQPSAGTDTMADRRLAGPQIAQTGKGDRAVPAGAGYCCVEIHAATMPRPAIRWGCPSTAEVVHKAEVSVDSDGGGGRTAAGAASGPIPAARAVVAGIGPLSGKVSGPYARTRRQRRA